MRRPVLVAALALAYCTALSAAEPETTPAAQANSASPGHVEASEQARAVQSAAPTEPAPAKPAPAAKPTGTSGNASAAESAGDKFKIPPSYKPTLRDGETVYCRKEVESGSRFKKRYCYTLAELKEVERQREELQTEMSRSRATCSSASSCASN
jgi:hypothetical protein